MGPGFVRSFSGYGPPRIRNGYGRHEPQHLRLLHQGGQQRLGDAVALAGHRAQPPVKGSLVRKVRDPQEDGGSRSRTGRRGNVLAEAPVVSVVTTSLPAARIAGHMRGMGGEARYSIALTGALVSSSRGHHLKLAMDPVTPNSDRLCGSFAEGCPPSLDSGQASPATGLHCRSWRPEPAGAETRLRSVSYRAARIHSRPSSGTTAARSCCRRRRAR